MAELERAESSGNAMALRTAIRYAEAAGLPEAELARARSRLSSIELTELDAPLTQPNMVQPVVRHDGGQEESVGFKTRVFGAAPAGSERDAGILTRVLGAPAENSEGLLTRVLGPAPSKDAGIFERMFPSASAAFGKCSAPSATLSSSITSTVSHATPGLRAAPVQHPASTSGNHARQSAPDTQPRLLVPPASSVSQAPYPYHIPSHSSSAHSGDPPTQPRLTVAVAEAPTTQPQLTPLNAPTTQPQMLNGYHEPSTQPQLH
eukprot:TRINITY_DN46233_c0_g1_i1.p1 TRINITY_DN46233_c0_g1~~TRINITY_DN46233_c0_g1_i1.p1  ORF type:complete len:291 (-),score=28.31 TRINITY_DN46233_c0_g1_i1:66-851(-)